MILWFSKIPFENNYLPRPAKEPEKWAEAKKGLEFGAAPMVEIDGMKLVESNAIIAYIAEKNGMIPDTIKGRYLVNSSYELLRDAIQGLVPFYYAPPEGKLAALEKAVTTLDSKLGYLEDRLKSNESQDYLVGTKVCTTDIMAMNFYFSFFLTLDGKEEHLAKMKEVLDKHPLYVKYVTNMRENHFKEYFETVRITPEP